MQAERDQLQRDKVQLEEENATLRQLLQAFQEKAARDFLDAGNKALEALAQEGNRSQKAMVDLQRRHEREMQEMRQKVEQGIQEWRTAIEQRDKTIGERDALLQQWMVIADRKKGIADRQGAELEQVQADKETLGQLRRDIVRKQRRVHILSERAKWRRKILQRIPGLELAALMESLEIPPGVDLNGREYEYDYDGEEMPGRSQSAPAELADEESAEPLQMSAPPERINEDLLRPEGIRWRAEAIRGEFIAAAEGQSAEARRDLGMEAMEALENLFRESRALGMGGKARPIIEGERRIIEANMQ
jgi:hypothetical protein